MAIDIRRYFTLSVPWVPAPHRTEWHPTEAAGPFATITCGAFASIAAAIAWAGAHLQGAPYSIVLCTWEAAGEGEGAYTPLLKGEEIAAADALPALPPLPPEPAPEAPPPAPAPAGAPEAPPPAAALDFGKLSPRAVLDARGWRARRRIPCPPAQIVRNHFGLSRDAGHLGPVPPKLDAAAFESYARIFRAVCGSDERIPEGERPRTEYRIRIGKRWLASLVCKPGGAVLADAPEAAGRFDGPVRFNAGESYGPAMTTGLARRLLDHAEKVWCEPVDGGPGFWMY